MGNEVATQNHGLTAKALFERDDVKKKFQDMLGKRATSFITSVLQIVASNDLLKNADPTSIYQSAAVAATLDLPLNNNLGFAYIVPFRDNKLNKVVAQFQLGAKGFKQLALRSGQFLTINDTDVRDGELKSYNRLTGQIEFEWMQDEKERSKLPIIGYACYFKLLNGFEKTYYMTVEDLKQHGLRFSQTFKKGFGLWKDDFDGMARKTVIKMNLSKNAPLSVEMQKAIITDQAEVSDAETVDVDYVDNDKLNSLVTEGEQQKEQLRQTQSESQQTLNMP